MLDISTLLPELKRLVTDLSEDLLARSTENAEVDAGLREAYTQIEKGGRTADAFEVWREDYLDQVAVAWVLACVFVRFMEDNGLIDECWLAGEGERRKQAEDSHELYFREHPHESDREYFEHVFREVGQIPACRDLFAEGKTPLWAVGPSGDAAIKLLAFWREIDAEGEGDKARLARSFKVENADTRFLGDLYQDLSERARKKYALLQTPVFVEEFILDRTLDPAIAAFGLDEVRMIDPTCGSGHFLLGGFQRLFDLWIKREDNEIVAAQKALDGVWGVDVNPFAVGVARFRLIVAALGACGTRRLKDAPGWKLHLATGDSLLFGSRWNQQGEKRAEQAFLASAEESWAPEIYACEDQDAISEVLGQQYHAVVGNPPYITVKDQKLNEAYRLRYSSCHRLYSLGVPFTERFFDLAVRADSHGGGHIGMITANSFMKRQFGKKLIEDFLPQVNLTHVIDTSGAFIPGHGTPTVVLFGRNARPDSDKVRGLLGTKGEPSTPENPAKGQVWTSITTLCDRPGQSDTFTTSSDIGRSILGKHPWSLTGGGAVELKERIESHCNDSLASYTNDIGFICITKQDEVFCQADSVVRRHKLEREYVRSFGVGENVRDWIHAGSGQVIFPYDKNTKTVPEDSIPHIIKFMTPFKASLNARKVFGGKTYEEVGKPWYEYGQIPVHRQKTQMALAFAEIASHNHFVLDRQATVFNQTAPVVKLPMPSSDDTYLFLLGLLNSSTACFWLKQVAHQKQMTGGDGVRIETRSKVPYQLAGTQLKKFPIPGGAVTSDIGMRITEIARQLESMAATVSEATARQVLKRFDDGSVSDIVAEWDSVQKQVSNTQERMVGLQEELDYTVYVLYGLCSETLLNTSYSQEYIVVPAGQRPYEISSGTSEDGFVVPETIPQEWTENVFSLWQQRMDAVKDSPELQLIEDAHYKRRWIGRQGVFNHSRRDDDLSRACKEWLLERLESNALWGGDPQLRSVAELTDKASGDAQFMTVASCYRGREDFDVTALVEEVILYDSVPCLPVLRYKTSGLRKRAVWEESWRVQRAKNAGVVGDDDPWTKKAEYKSTDFVSGNYWRIRGKLDVPRERWVSFPHCETESDTSLVVGWAGWNHLQQATALVAYYDARKRDGWDAKRLTPLLAGLDQLLPWIHQWHPEIDPEFGETAGQSFQTMLEADAHELGLTLEEIRAWEPPKKTKKARRKRKTT